MVKKQLPRDSFPALFRLMGGHGSASWAEVATE